MEKHQEMPDSRLYWEVKRKSWEKTATNYFHIVAKKFIDIAMNLPESILTQKRSSYEHKWLPSKFCTEKFAFKITIHFVKKLSSYDTC